MTKSTITREQLLEIIETDHVQCGEASYLASMALAAMDSEPVAEITEDLGRLFVKIHYPTTLRAGDKLYLHAQPAPVVSSEPVAYTDERNLGYIDRGRETAYLWGKQNSESSDVALYRHAQQPVVPPMQHWEELCREHPDMSIGDAIIRAAWWNHCRAAMLQGDNSPVIPDSARDALEKALAAMEFMGDTLNNLDAVCTEDVEFVAPAFNAVRTVLAAASREVKP